MEYRALDGPLRNLIVCGLYWLHHSMLHGRGREDGTLPWNALPLSRQRSAIAFFLTHLRGSKENIPSAWYADFLLNEGVRTFVWRMEAIRDGKPRTEYMWEERLLLQSFIQVLLEQHDLEYAPPEDLRRFISNHFSHATSMDSVAAATAILASCVAEFRGMATSIAGEHPLALYLIGRSEPDRTDSPREYHEPFIPIVSPVLVGSSLNSYFYSEIPQVTRFETLFMTSCCRLPDEAKWRHDTNLSRLLLPGLWEDAGARLKCSR
jgi:hypothetical protein